ncbi:UvrB/UvrC motif-containing protein [Natronospora cellulosivora (SeqCode)]
MKCQRCNEKDASIHLTKIINGKKNEVYLCEKCAKETGQLNFANNNPFTFQNLLKGILNPQMESYEQHKEDQNCDNCGLTYKDFSKNGFLGCASCYNSFYEKLDPLLKRIHGSNRHNGKVPKRRGGDLKIKKEIQVMREKMSEAVKKENFERAAEIRDKIKILKNKIGGDEVNVN